MSGIEIAVIVFGLFIGYWLVAKLIPGRRKPEPGEQPDHSDPSA
jgi:hypothetical protein